MKVSGVVALQVLVSVARLVSGHSIEFGRCRSVAADPHFHPDELTGLWYVIEMFRTGSHCMTLTFARTAEGFTGTEVRELAAVRAIGLDHTVSNTGVFTIRSMDYPAVMKVRWPSVFIDKPAEVTVVDTDGDNFAVLYECQTLWVFRRTSAVILSRTPTLPDDLLARIKEDLVKMNIKVQKFDKIKHDEHCKTLGKADLNLDLNLLLRHVKERWARRGGSGRGSGPVASPLVSPKRPPSSPRRPSKRN
ncbi:apolipoprotein D-like [Eriocheir sinensis]|uniref:apolipoprotein D-like n=1 Tax=Eriocheir sinensis TaxID=95602 RepID=UPI0021C8D62B|nr:apolipoprotein D-like [Eriocheir sinensis]XP_050707989.1 apolipoprotein D-like [Eriocheir sinensis]